MHCRPQVCQLNYCYELSTLNMVTLLYFSTSLKTAIILVCNRKQDLGERGEKEVLFQIMQCGERGYEI